MVKRLALLICLAQFSFGQTNAGGRTGEIRGSVVSALTGEALASAQVWLRSTQGKRPLQLTSATGPAGEFAFKALPPAGYTLSAEKAGYSNGPQSAPDLVLEDGGRVEHLKILLWQAVAISGIVRDADGEPFPDAEVHAYGYDFDAAEPRIVSLGNAFTDDRGMFRIHGLPSGEHIIGVLPPRHETLRGELQARTAVYFPGSIDLADTIPLQAGWGEEFGAIDLRLPGSSTYAVAGTARDSSGALCGACEITVVRRAERFFAGLAGRTETSGSGHFLIHGLSPGSYFVIARWAGPARDHFDHQEFEIVNADLPALDLVVKPGSDVGGALIPADTAADFDAGRIRVWLTPASVPAGLPHRSAEVRQDLTFRVPDVPAGLYRVRLKSLPPGAYLKEIRLSGQKHPGPHVRVSDTGLQAVRLILGFDSGAVAGGVKPGVAGGVKPGVTGSWIAMLPADPKDPYLEERLVESDSEGAFRFDGVAPGNYTLLSVPRDRKRDIQDPRRRTSLQRYSTQVVVGPGGQHAVELSLPPQGGL